MTGRGLGRPMPSRFPYPGRPWPQPGVASGSGQIIRARFIIVSGAGGGIFLYNGTPGKGNPPVAWFTNASSDPYGNKVEPQFQVYDPSTGAGFRLSGSQLVILGPGSTTNGFLATQRNGTGAASFTQLTLSGPSDGDALAQLLLFGESADGSQSAYGVLQGYSLSGAEAQAVTWQVNGVLTATMPGSVTGAKPEGVPETWHSLPLPSGATGYLRYMLLPYATVRLQAELQWSTGQALNLSLGNLPSSPAGYLPATGFKDSCGVFVTSGANNVRVNVTTGGAINILGSGTSVNEIDFCKDIPLG